MQGRSSLVFIVYICFCSGNSGVSGHRMHANHKRTTHTHTHGPAAFLAISYAFARNDHFRCIVVGVFRVYFKFRFAFNASKLITANVRRGWLITIYIPATSCATAVHGYHHLNVCARKLFQITVRPYSLSALMWPIIYNSWWSTAARYLHYSVYMRRIIHARSTRIRYSGRDFAYTHDIT